MIKAPDGSLFEITAIQKLSPFTGKVAWRSHDERGTAQITKCSALLPLSFAYAQQNAGWNMVVLLRCRLQHSLFRPILPSLYRPLGALGSNSPHAVAPLTPSVTAYAVPAPRRGEPFVRLTTSLVHPPLGGFHIAKQYFTARQRNFTLRQQNSTVGGSSPRHRRSCPCRTG